MKIELREITWDYPDGPNVVTRSLKVEEEGKRVRQRDAMQKKRQKRLEA